MKRKLDIIKKRDEERGQDEEIHAKIVLNSKPQTEALKKVETAIEKLHESINDQEPLDLSVLEKQLDTLNERLNLTDALEGIKQAVADSKTETVSIKQFSDLLQAVKDNKPLPVKLDVSSLEKAIIQVQQRIQDASAPNQAPDEYTAMRRVIKVGNRLIFDDTPTGAGRGGGGISSGSSSSVVSGAVIIQDAGGEQATVTGGKLDVNATASLAGDSVPVAGATSAVSVQVVDGSGNQISSFGGGTQYTEDAAAAADPVGNMMIARRKDTLVTNQVSADGDNIAVNATNKGELNVAANLKEVNGNSISSVASGVMKVGISDTGGNSYVSASHGLNSTGTGIMASAMLAEFDDSSPTSITENQFGMVRMSQNRNLYSTIRDAGGNERGVSVTASNALKVDGSAVTQPVDGSAVTQPISAASLPLPLGAATSAKQDSQTTLLTTIDGDTSTLAAVDFATSAKQDDIITAIEAIPGGGGGSGTEYTEGDTDASITGTAIMWEDGSDTLRAVSASKPLPIADAGGSLTVDGSVTAAVEKASSASINRVATSTTSATLLSSNSSRVQAVIVNDATDILYVKYGTTATSTDYTHKLYVDDVLVIDQYTGRIDAILASGSGNAQCTEL